MNNVLLWLWIQADPAAEGRELLQYSLGLLDALGLLTLVRAVLWMFIIVGLTSFILQRLFAR